MESYNQLDNQIDDFILEKIVEILNDPSLVDKAVEAAAVCRKGDEIVSLKDFNDVFDENGYFKFSKNNRDNINKSQAWSLNGIPGDFKLVQFKRVHDEINPLLPYISPKVKLILQGAITEAGAQTFDKFGALDPTLHANDEPISFNQIQKALDRFKEKLASDPVSMIKLVEYLSDKYVTHYTMPPEVISPEVLKKQETLMHEQIMAFLFDKPSIDKDLILIRLRLLAKKLIESPKGVDLDRLVILEKILTDTINNPDSQLGQIFREPRSFLSKTFGFFMPDESKGTLLILSEVLKDVHSYIDKANIAKVNSNNVLKIIRSNPQFKFTEKKPATAEKQNEIRPAISYIRK